jgi:predicted oxidoreductase (fatty acid repression mutant protein)
VGQLVNVHKRRSKLSRDLQARNKNFSSRNACSATPNSLTKNAKRSVVILTDKEKKVNTSVDSLLTKKCQNELVIAQKILSCEAFSIGIKVSYFV